MYPIEKYQFKTYTQTNKDGTTTKAVVALSTYAGRVVRGVAKCRDDDTFDLEKGKQLAAARCDFKVCSKRMRQSFKKCLEMDKKIATLREHHRKLNNRYSNAHNEWTESHLRLSVIEDSLK